MVLLERAWVSPTLASWLRKCPLGSLQEPPASPPTAPQRWTRQLDQDNKGPQLQRHSASIYYAHSTLYHNHMTPLSMLRVSSGQVLLVSSHVWFRQSVLHSLSINFRVTSSCFLTLGARGRDSRLSGTINPNIGGSGFQPTFSPSNSAGFLLLVVPQKTSTNSEE